LRNVFIAAAQKTNSALLSRVGLLGTMQKVRDGWVATVRELGRYALVGGLGTGLNAGLYLGLRTWWDATPANLAALVLSTLVSTELNRRFTFAAGRGEPWRRHLQTAGTVTFYACYSSLVVAVLGALVAEPTPLLESAAVATASVLGGLGRYLLLRRWVFGQATPAARPLPVWAARVRGVLRGPAVAAGSATAA
jgi:putative flippase GtrA